MVENGIHELTNNRLLGFICKIMQDAPKLDAIRMNRTVSRIVNTDICVLKADGS